MGADARAGNDIIAPYAAPVIAYHGWVLRRRTELLLTFQVSRFEPIAYGVLASAIFLNAEPIDAFIYFQF